MPIPTAYEGVMERAVRDLRQVLGHNLYSCMVYGSAVRGDLVEKMSDVDLLLILNESTPEAHTAIAEIVRRDRIIDPFIITRRQMHRSFEVFALKFLSIQRDYQVLAGEDALADLEIPEPVVRFLCEQALRNLRLRCVRAFVLSGDNGQAYTKFLMRIRTSLLVDLAALLRLSGVKIPKDFNTRIPVIEKELGIEASVLDEIDIIRADIRVLSEAEITTLHGKLFRLLDNTVLWLERRWPDP